MSDRKLLEMAARAAGIEIDHWAEAYFESHRDGEVAFYESGRYMDEWNPLTDDGDALRLAVDADIGITFEAYGCVMAGRRDRGGSWDAEEDIAGDKRAATRRAVVRAAAEIGRKK